MRGLRATSFLFLLCLFAAGYVWAEPVVPANSQEGIRRLERAEEKADFIPLANHFEGQANPSFCGVASAVIVLNSFRSGAEHLTQDSFFNADTDKIKTRAEVLGGHPAGKKPDAGFQLSQLQKMLAAHRMLVDIHVATSGDVEEPLRRDLQTNLVNKDDFIIVNYYRPKLGQKGGGHISPVGAYDEESDSVLILDVNSEEQEWVWVTVHDLLEAMKTFDTTQNRGYLLVFQGASENKTMRAG